MSVSSTHAQSSRSVGEPVYGTDLEELEKKDHLSTALDVMEHARREAEQSGAMTDGGTGGSREVKVMSLAAYELNIHFLNCPRPAYPIPDVRP